MRTKGTLDAVCAAVFIVFLSQLPTQVNTDQITPSDTLQRLKQLLKYDNSKQHYMTSATQPLQVYTTADPIKSQLYKLLKILNSDEKSFKQQMITVESKSLDFQTTTNMQTSLNERDDERDKEWKNNIKLAKLLLKRLAGRKSAKKYKTVQYLWDYDPFGGGVFG